MKANACRILLAVAAGFIPVAVAGQTESSLPGGKPALMDSPHPGLAGIDSPCVRILRGGNDRNANGLDWARLYAQVTGKLGNAGMKLNSEISQNTSNSPELRIYIEVLRLEDSTTRVFRIQTSLARAVCLTEKRHPVLKAEIWQASPVLQAVPTDDLPVTVTDVVIKQVEAFVLTWQASNPPDSQPSEDRTKQADSPMAQENGPEPDAGSGATEHQYIASRSSGVFHRPGCRWAQNISAENRIAYNSREEAIKDGKRPCKSCNP
jgi:micrococcal nuclease